MNKVAGEYYKQNHSSALKYCKEDGIYTFYYDIDVNHKPIRISGFNKFMPCISILYSENIDSPYIHSHINEFESINQIKLRALNIDEKFDLFKQLLSQLQIIQCTGCSVVGDFYDLILKYCKNLKEIHVEYLVAGSRINRKLNWLLQKYPKLERLTCMPCDSYQFKEIREFFVRNPNVQRFSTSAESWCKNGDIFLNSNVKLDILELKRSRIRYWLQPHGKKTSETSFELLNQLHEQGFYKRLYIYIRRLSGKRITQLATFKGLELLCILLFDKSYNLAQLTNLRELIILDGSRAPKDMEILANGLIKLERFYIDNGSIDNIMPFIRRSPKLNKIKFLPRNKGVILNLTMLNSERAKLVGARKIIIYTRDDVFLATKWTTRNGDTNLSFIEMRRADSIEWNHNY
ncbi:uncharacterized protein LOC116349275 [Contarinia nasturtii]|uniref:uncharacterized protein LOC116349275 n=1 Tax=Contarinia nasturtii TaxID=265458 RepID=UPI0012D4855E|nr:uncharacterized protein LOC116349275 [Contarinia nasturtii]